ncbi:MAG: sigma-70 family RNA polymerase sigma factor [Clostridia bacterium]|nr:sigma-70 family RNA polymerase sigma factor [Clostridia bacterium]
MNDRLIEKRLRQLRKNGNLTSEDIISLFKEYEIDKLNNIPKQDSVARAMLIVENVKLVYFVLNSKLGFNCVNETMEEFGAGQVGLIKAVDTFDVNKNIKFSTYAARIIINEIFIYYRVENAQRNLSEKNKISFEEPIQLNNKNENLTVKDILGEDDENLVDFDEKELVKEVINNMRFLNENEQKAVIYTFGLFGNDILTQREMSKIINRSRAFVSRCLDMGIKKLRALTLKPEQLSREEQILRYTLLKKIRESDENLGLK